MTLLAIDEQCYHNLVFNTGVAFAEYYYGNDAEVVSVITQTPAYWQWWSNHFQQLADVFYSKHKNTRTEGAELFVLLEQALAPAKVQAFPNQYAIDEALSKVWGITWKEEHKVQAQKKGGAHV